jgi:hypothetical protein
LFEFVIKSYIFKRLFIASLILVTLIIAGNKLFDKYWNSSCSFALTDLNDVYMPPAEYDNIKKVNLSLIPPGRICIEGNQRFTIIGSGKNFGFFDTVKIIYPADKLSYRNRISLQFEDSKYPDSIYIDVAKSDDKNIYWYQVFLNSVIVNKLNETGKDTAGFRTDKKRLCSQTLLDNNDTLVNRVISYFNTNKDILKLAECGTNTRVFMQICEIYKLPSRIIILQGGNADVLGYNDEIGYPTHVVCEVYSSKYKKWYVIDPTFGVRFKQKGSEDFINAAEISNYYFFLKNKEIQQDSILFTKSPALLERDYFKYYENVYIESGFKPNFLLKKILDLFYRRLNYSAYIYSNITPCIENAKDYLIFKSIMFLVLFSLYTFFVILILSKRLMQSKIVANSKTL